MVVQIEEPWFNLWGGSCDGKRDLGGRPEFILVCDPVALNVIQPWYTP